MSTPDKKSHWDSLASTLGAKQAPTPQPKYVPPVETPAPPPAAESAETPAPPSLPAKPAAKPKSSPPKKRDSWGTVLTALGLRAPEPEPEPDPIPAAPEPVVEAPTFSPSLGSSSPKNLWELLGDQPPTGEPIASPPERDREIVSGEVGGNDLLLGEEEEEVSTGWRRRPEPLDLSGAEPPSRRSRHDEDRPRAASSESRSRGDDRPRERTERKDEESEDRPRRRRRRRRRGESGVELEHRPVERTQHDDDDYVAEVEENLEHVSADLDDADYDSPREYQDDFDRPAAPANEENGERTGRKRRRRRRRRGGRGAEETTAEPLETTADPTDYHDEIDDDSQRRPEPARPARREPARHPAPQPRSRVNDRSREVDDDHDDDDDDDDHSLDAAGHKGIPTWHEAVGAVVSANIESRSRQPQSSRGGRGRGGRGRGGRGSR